MMLPLTLALLAASQTPYEEHRCGDPQNQHDMNACAEIDFLGADADLNRVWGETLVRVRASDAGIDRSYDERPSSEDKLREAQTAWAVFRDAHCTYEAYEEARGGSMEPMVYEGCRAQLTRERIRQLSGPPEPEPEQ